MKCVVSPDLSKSRQESSREHSWSRSHRNSRSTGSREAQLAESGRPQKEEQKPGLAGGSTVCEGHGRRGVATQEWGIECESQVCALYPFEQPLKLEKEIQNFNR